MQRYPAVEGLIIPQAGHFSVEPDVNQSQKQSERCVRHFPSLDPAGP
jgi:hypothetical protein